jgi:hypothetical protein
MMTLNLYRTTDTPELIELGLASRDDLARVLAERLEDAEVALGMAEHSASDAADLRRWLTAAEEELNAYRAAEINGGYRA